MAVTKTSTITALAGNLIIDFEADSSSENNVTGNTSGTFYLVEVDNTLNASTFAYVKIRDASSATPSHATNGIPTWQFASPPGTKTSYAFPEGQDYSAGLSMWCTSNPAHQNTTSPTSAVTVKIVSS
jgi:hypothetical protein|tara:strand:- start:52 stop:432 length:381 start_codon:yes stop_codon:yes gene_type:complete